MKEPAASQHLRKAAEIPYSGKQTTPACLQEGVRPAIGIHAAKNVMTRSLYPARAWIKGKRYTGKRAGHVPNVVFRTLPFVQFPKNIGGRRAVSGESPA